MNYEDWIQKIFLACLALVLVVFLGIVLYIFYSAVFRGGSTGNFYVEQCVNHEGVVVIREVDWSQDYMATDCMPDVEKAMDIAKRMKQEWGSNLKAEK